MEQSGLNRLNLRVLVRELTEKYEFRVLRELRNRENLYFVKKLRFGENLLAFNHSQASHTSIFQFHVQVKVQKVISCRKLNFKQRKSDSKTL